MVDLALIVEQARGVRNKFPKEEKEKASWIREHSKGPYKNEQQVDLQVKQFSICGVASFLLEVHYRIIKSKVLAFVITMKKCKWKENTDLLAEHVKHNVRWAAQNGI